VFGEKASWTGLIDYLRQNSGMTRQLSGERYRIIHIEPNDLFPDDLYKLGESIINNQIHSVQIPPTIVQRAYDRFAMPGTTPTSSPEWNTKEMTTGIHPNTTYDEPNTIPHEPNVFKQRSTPYQSGSKIDPAPSPSFIRSLLFGVIRVGIGIGCLLSLYFLVRWFIYARESKKNVYSPPGFNTQYHHIKAQQKSDPSNNAQLAGQLIYRMSKLEKMHAEGIGNITKQRNEMKEQFENLSSEIMRYLMDESDRISALDSSVQAISKRLDAYNNFFDQYDTQLSEILVYIKKQGTHTHKSPSNEQMDQRLADIEKITEHLSNSIEAWDRANSTRQNHSQPLQFNADDPVEQLKETLAASNAELMNEFDRLHRGLVGDDKHPLVFEVLNRMDDIRKVLIRQSENGESNETL
jgi:hypothetical protein